MNTGNKEQDLWENRTSPVQHPDSPSNCMSARLQEEYSELLKYAVGMPAADKRTQEVSSHIFRPISGSEVPSSRQTPVDRHFGSDATGSPRNTNTNALYTSQQSSYRNAAVKGQNTNVGSMGRSDYNENTVADGEFDRSTSALSSSSVDACQVPSMEPSVNYLSTKLDSLLGKLKCDILSEYRYLTAQVLESQRRSQQQDLQEITSRKVRLEQEVNRLNELINTSEQSISRKDTVIENMTQALGRQRDRVTMAQAFYRARAEQADAVREKFADALATQHNTRRLKKKIFSAWFGVVQTRWKCRFEKIYDQKAQDVCKQLSRDYEDKISSLNEEIQHMTRKLKTLQNEREQYALHVKKAFMRGVCALNMETMSAFTHEEPPASPLLIDLEDNSNTCNVNNHESSFPHKDDLYLKQVHSDIIISSVPDTQPTGGQLSSLTVVGTGQSLPKKTKPQKGKVRQATAPSGSSSHHQVTWGTSQSLAPPMASVVVERHDPVTKQTVGKATASRFPKHNSARGSLSSQTNKPTAALHSSVSKSLPAFHTFQPLAGQPTTVITNPGIKVVE